MKSVGPLRGQGLELEVIAAAVIGGTLLSGGYGSIVGTLVGTTLMGMLAHRSGLAQRPGQCLPGCDRRNYDRGGRHQHALPSPKVGRI